MDDQRTGRAGGDGVTRFSIKGLLLAVAIIAVVIVVCQRTGSVEIAKLQGDKIIKALKQYGANHGEYPASLSDLCPQYLEHIQSPWWGVREWTCTRAKGDFELGVRETESAPDGEHYWLYQVGASGRWEMMD
jgi:hypothetical protein